MVLDQARITKDSFVSVLGGFCFLARAKALLQVDYFDEKYKKSCEDIDLCLKLRINKWDLMVCSNAYVSHKCGKSRIYVFCVQNCISSIGDLFIYID